MCVNTRPDSVTKSFFVADDISYRGELGLDVTQRFRFRLRMTGDWFGKVRKEDAHNMTYTGLSNRPEVILEVAAAGVRPGDDLVGGEVTNAGALGAGLGRDP